MQITGSAENACIFQTGVTVGGKKVFGNAGSELSLAGNE
jgi:hypothetical protein